MQRVKTSKTGVYYHQLLDGDKVYYITYKDLKTTKKIWIKIGKYSEGIRENYCLQKRNEILTMMRLGEEPPAIAKKKKAKINYLSNIATEYFNQRKDNGTTKSDKAIFEHYISPHFQDIDSIDKSSLEKWNKYLQTAKQKNNANKTLSPKYQNDLKGLLISINKYGLKHDLTNNDISKYIQKTQIDNERERYLTIEEIVKLYETVKDNEQLYLFCKLALTTGARLATILNISKKDINFTNQIITLKDFKNNSTYKSFLTDELIDILNTWTKELNLSDKIFYDKPTMIQREVLSVLHKLFNKGIDRSDRKNLVVVHTLRHTFASHLAINGTPIFTIQKLMNHKDIKMTLRYAKLAPDSGKEAIKDLYNI